MRSNARVPDSILPLTFRVMDRAQDNCDYLFSGLILAGTVKATK
jgi:hypothetical protein